MVTASIFKKLKARYHPGKIVASLIETAIIGAAVLTLWKTQIFGSYLRPWIGAVLSYWIGQGGISSIFFAGLILVMALRKGIFSLWLSRKPFVLLGEISFAMYLFHQILIRYYELHMDAFKGFSTVILFGMFLMILFIISYLAWAIVENPGRRFINAAISHIRIH